MNQTLSTSSSEIKVLNFMLYTSKFGQNIFAEFPIKEALCKFKLIITL